MFLQLTCDDAADLPIPDEKYTFGQLKQLWQARSEEAAAEPTPGPESPPASESSPAPPPTAPEAPPAPEGGSEPHPEGGPG